MESTICHFEIPADDLDAARSFYGKLFGWTIEPAPSLAESYYFIRTSQRGVRVAPGRLLAVGRETYRLRSHSCSLLRYCSLLHRKWALARARLRSINGTALPRR